MKSIKPLQVTNYKPTIVVSNKCLAAIKYIVSIAPQEAQWFHTVTPEWSKNSKNEVKLHLSDELYIPKQNTSAVQVDSTSSMLIEFYNELKEKYDDQTTINNILTNMTCWCHSHHNMAPSPSAQDYTQFNNFVKSAKDQNLNNWQIMLIFNKQDNFYARVFDPNTNLIFEGVNIEVTNDYDFSYIDLAAKEKFLKPKPKFQSYTKPFPNSWFNKKTKPSHKTTTKPSFIPRTKPFDALDESELITEQLIEDFPLHLHNGRKVLSLDSDRIDQFYTRLDEYLNDKQKVWFLMLSTGHEHLVHKYFTDKAFAKKNYDLDAMIQDYSWDLANAMCIAEIRDNIEAVLDISNMKRVHEVESYVKKYYEVTDLYEGVDLG